ncbi:MAG TPA: hypothetical protein VFK05_25135 [Polyangiaceae bacterium]|nr:hypothetical protein [Polyangiaceae bacterium]
MPRVLFALLGLASLVLVACSDDPPAPKPNPLSSCLEQPGQVPRPPAGKLPCELIPPSLSIK